LFRILFGFFLLAMWNQSFSQEYVKWASFEKSIEKQKTIPKKMMVEVYASWCKYCKKMNDSTFTNPAIIQYINEHFYAVKLNGESKDTIHYKNKIYTNPNPAGENSNNEIVFELTKTANPYPTIVFFDEQLNVIYTSNGYMNASRFEPILHWIGEGNYLTISLDEYLRLNK